MSLYKLQELPDLEFEWENGTKATPLATLVNEHGGRAQITEYDHYYVLLLRQENDGRYRPTYWWFREAVDAVRRLPLPS